MYFDFSHPFLFCFWASPERTPRRGFDIRSGCAQSRDQDCSLRLPADYTVASKLSVSVSPRPFEIQTRGCSSGVARLSALTYRSTVHRGFVLMALLRVLPDWRPGGRSTVSLRIWESWFRVCGLYSLILGLQGKGTEKEKDG